MPRKILLLTGYLCKKDMYRTLQKDLDIDIYEWWREKKVSLDVIRDHAKNYKYIISHSAGSTLLFLTLMNYKLAHLKKVFSFDGHILMKKTKKSPKPAIAIKSTMKRLPKTSTIYKKLQKVLSRNLDKYSDWLNLLVNAHNLLRNTDRGLRDVSWVEVQSTKVSETESYARYSRKSTRSNNTDTFSKVLSNTIVDSTIFLVANSNHYIVITKARHFVGMIYSYFYNKPLHKNIPDSRYSKNKETGFDKRIKSSGAIFYKFPQKHPRPGVSRAKFFVPYRTVSWSHPWDIRCQILKGLGLELDSRSGLLRCINPNDNFKIPGGVCHVFVAGDKVLELDVKAYIHGMKKSYELCPINFMK